MVGVDDRPQACDALALGAALADALGAGLIVASVFPSESRLTSAHTQELRDKAERTAANALDWLADGVAAEKRVVPGRSPAHGLHDLAESLDAAAIVVGSSHRGPLERVLVGNVAAQLFAGGPCPVLVAPRGLADRGPLALRVIGVGFDDSGESWNALGRAASLAAATGGSVRVIHALAPLTSAPNSPLAPVEAELKVRRSSELATERAVASLSKEVRPESRLVSGDPVRVLETEGDRDLDLMVLGSRGFGPVRRVLLGSVSSDIVRLAPCPVMIVPR
jgi:nucleotide-binding universal stress UspA family protein